MIDSDRLIKELDRLYKEGVQMLNSDNNYESGIGKGYIECLGKIEKHIAKTFFIQSIKGGLDKSIIDDKDLEYILDQDCPLNHRKDKNNPFEDNKCPRCNADLF